MSTNDLREALAEQVLSARQTGRPLRIIGGDTKAFYGHRIQGDVLTVAGHAGIVAYEPAELVVTVRAGTAVDDLDGILEREGQYLPFESPRFGPGTTIGGAVAAGLAGPRRPWAGGVRDYVLGARVLTGRGEILGFGGQVMKNVAGYDVSRLMAGSMGCLGIILELSLKLLPLPQAQLSLALEVDVERALTMLATVGRRPLPLSGACHDGGVLRLRLSGGQASVAAAARELGGDLDDDGFWGALRDQRLPFFASEDPLWRVSVPPATAPLDLDGPQLYDWGGAQRWLRSPGPTQDIRLAAATAGGHATRFRGGEDDDPVFHPLDPALMSIQQNVKRAMDPDGILNPGRMYAEL